MAQSARGYQVAAPHQRIDEASNVTERVTVRWKGDPNLEHGTNTSTGAAAAAALRSADRVLRSIAE